ncbi:hypothetical protein [Paramagnetospirillum kuznetsovii]|uniref:hypothetical protein n=1 Tax=Paramagnetospirillum kuznetsovii TaxID=2053833 RepID=UPI0013751A74|nr:hypothetical protein [Paramagnetospirillum kuznetsovii]
MQFDDPSSLFDANIAQIVRAEFDVTTEGGIVPHHPFTMRTAHKLHSLFLLGLFREGSI